MRSWLARFPFFYVGILPIGLAAAIHAPILLVAFVGYVFDLPALEWSTSREVLVFEGALLLLGIFCIAIDIGLVLPEKRRGHRDPGPVADGPVTVVLTAYNDELSVGAAVRDFLAQPQVKRVIVVSNNSKDRTEEEARAAGAIVYNEPAQGYGKCVYRCLVEGLACEDSPLILLCEGDMTFRAADIDKFLAYIRHADIVNGTRIVEQLREYHTQLSSFMYYGNFAVGKLLEVKHLGRGTFTDAGTTYKMIRRDKLPRLLSLLNPEVNLEFNFHFLDVALANNFLLVECPVTFHPRLGESKGGNVNNWRALSVGMRMMIGLSCDWMLWPKKKPAISATSGSV